MGRGGSLRAITRVCFTSVGRHRIDSVTVRGMKTEEKSGPNSKSLIILARYVQLICTNSTEPPSVLNGLGHPCSEALIVHLTWMISD